MSSSSFEKFGSQNISVKMLLHDLYRSISKGRILISLRRQALMIDMVQYYSLFGAIYAIINNDLLKS